MSFNSPANSESSPVQSPDGKMGGAWGGSEYLGGGLFTDMIDSGKNFYNGFIVHSDTISALCIARGLLSVVTLLFILLLMAYASNTLSLTSSNAMGIGGMAIALLILSFVADLCIALKPDLLKHTPDNAPVVNAPEA